MIKTLMFDFRVRVIRVHYKSLLYQVQFTVHDSVLEKKKNRCRLLSEPVYLIYVGFLPDVPAERGGAAGCGRALYRHAGRRHQSHLLQDRANRAVVL